VQTASSPCTTTTAGVFGYRNATDSRTIWIRFRWGDRSRRLTIERDERMKKWLGGAREFAVEVVGGQAKQRRVEFQGSKVQVKL